MKSTFTYWRHTAGVTVLMLILSGAALADSSKVAYQGVLRTAGGPAVADGVYSMAFSLWDAPTGGNELWVEAHGAVSLADGAFSVLLGGNTAFGTLFADESALWLQIAVDTEIYDPRIPLTSVPYARAARTASTADTAISATHTASTDLAAAAAHAAAVDSATSAATASGTGNAATLGGQLPSAFAAAGHTHDASHITSGTLSTDRYSAYADLGAESRIGAAATQVAAGNHRHDNLPYWVGTVGGQTSGTKVLNPQNENMITRVATGGGHGLVAPVAGRYFVHFQQLTQTINATYLSLRHNNNILAYSWVNGGVSHKDMIVTRVVDMNAGDIITFTVDVQVQGYAWSGEHSSVSMYLIGQP